MDLLYFKKYIDSHGPAIVENIGNILNPLILKFRNENNRLLVFYFHGLYLSEKEKQLNHSDPQNNITVAQFENFIDYFLVNGYKFVGPEDLKTGLDGSKPYVMVTFDDGYFNNILACDILEKYEIPALFFITTGNVMHNSSFWWDVIFKYRFKQGKNLEAIRREQFSLKSLKHNQITDYISSSFGNSSFNPWSDIDRPLSASEVKILSGCRYASIGNHTHNHSILTNNSPEEILEEFRISNQILFDLTGKYPNTLAFPNGDYNDTVIELSKAQGFDHGFTTIHRPNILAGNDGNLFLVNRFMAETGNVQKFGSFSRVGYSPVPFYYEIKDYLSLRKKRQKK